MFVFQEPTVALAKLFGLSVIVGAGATIGATKVAPLLGTSIDAFMAVNAMLAKLVVDRVTVTKVTEGGAGQPT